MRRMQSSVFLTQGVRFGCSSAFKPKKFFSDTVATPLNFFVAAYVSGIALWILSLATKTMMHNHNRKLLTCDAQKGPTF